MWVGLVTPGCDMIRSRRDADVEFRVILIGLAPFSVGIDEDESS